MNDEQKAILKDAVEWVEWQATLEPGARAWEQDQWITLREDTASCGTAYCLAGYIGQKHNPIFVNDSLGTVNGRTWHVSDYATMLLGVEPDGWADKQLSHQFEKDGGEYYFDLYDGDNTAEDIRRIAEHLAGGPL